MHAMRTRNVASSRGPRARCALLAAVLLAGCLSGLGGTPQRLRYFSAAAPPGGAGPVREDVPPIRLRQVTAASHLGERMVWRLSGVEYGFYETRRWTEQPVAWVQAALARELFEKRGVRRTRALASPTLDVHLAAFDEVLQPERRAEVALVVRFYGPEGDAWLEHTLVRSEPVEGEDPADVAQAMSRVLGTATRDAATMVLERVLAQ